MANFLSAIANYLIAAASSILIQQQQQKLQKMWWIVPTLLAAAALLLLRRSSTFSKIVWQIMRWLVPPVGERPLVPAHQKPLLVIPFDARKPTNAGWRDAESGEAVRFSEPADAPGAGYLKIDVPNRFAMDRFIAGVARLAKRIEFKIKLPKDAAIYAGVILRDEGGEIVRSDRDGGLHWITYCIGDENLAPEPDERYSNEVVLRMSGRIIGNGYVACSRDLEADVQKAYPGCYFSSLDRIRIRGRENSLSISPIRLLEN
jgi:hypothetical protein